MASVNQKAINLWTARVIPIVLVGLAGYSTINTTPVDYLLKPAPTVRNTRSGAGIAILTVYNSLLLLLALAYFRLIHTVITNPGYTPRGPQWHAQNANKRRHSRSHRAKQTPSDLEKQNGSLGQHSTYSETLSALPYNHDSSVYGPADGIAAPGLQDFYQRDVFSCESDGRPIWCSTCLNWKLDRAHHCREKNGVNIHWVVVLSLAALFSLFLLGMGASSLQFVFQNTTTIENLSRKTKVWQLAIHMPNTMLQTDNPSLFRTITYGPDPTSTRTFAILHSKPGENPWDLGYIRNFKAVMGEHWYDWILPIKRSPCTNHDRLDCEFETGPVVERMKREAGIDAPSPSETIDGKSRRHRRRRQRRRRSTHLRGEDRVVENGTDGERHHRHERRRSESRRHSGES
ncbi:MAG: hypothetical protein Q9186_006853 [Xanthomendoza sp. 1 TL-2023]